MMVLFLLISCLCVLMVVLLVYCKYVVNVLVMEG